MKIIKQESGPSGIRRLCFAERERGVRGAQIAEEMAPIIMESIRALWFTAQRLKVRVIFDRVIATAAKQGIPAGRHPCRQTIRRILKALPPYAAMSARKGARAADDKYRSKGQMAATAMPGQVYEVDAHKMDFVGVDDRWWLPLGRLWVTVVIDRCTRMIVGVHFHVEPPSSITIAAALRNAFAPKLYMLKRWPGIGRPWVAWGLPALVVLDNGGLPSPRSNESFAIIPAGSTAWQTVSTVTNNLTIAAVSEDATGKPIALWAQGGNLTTAHFLRLLLPR